MLRPRIIPCLLVKDNALVKTLRFASPRYVGDPLNAVRIFNEKEVDELIVLDIGATVDKREVNFDLIRNLAAECRMPLCYGGGVSSVEQADRIISMGIEKVGISASAVEQPDLVGALAQSIGSQSVVVVLDIWQHGPGEYEVRTHNGRRGTGSDPVEIARRAEECGAGEILINSIDRDGVMKGYDLDLAKRVRESIAVPMTVLGGAGSQEHLRDLIQTLGIIGAAAGSLFVFKGPYRAVLISYPDRNVRDALSAAGLSARLANLGGAC